MTRRVVREVVAIPALFTFRALIEAIYIRSRALYKCMNGYPTTPRSGKGPCHEPTPKWSLDIYRFRPTRNNVALWRKGCAPPNLNKPLPPVPLEAQKQRPKEKISNYIQQALLGSKHGASPAQVWSREPGQAQTACQGNQQLKRQVQWWF